MKVWMVEHPNGNYYDGNWWNQSGFSGEGKNTPKIYRNINSAKRVLNQGKRAPGGFKTEWEGCRVVEFELVMVKHEEVLF